MDGLKIEGLRVTFSVKRTLKPEPNAAEVTITNLSRDTRARIRTGSRLTLVAGYEGNAAVIFVGDVRTVQSVVEGPDVTTKITAGDGDTAYRQAVVSESFAPGTTLENMVGKMAGALGIDSARAVQRMKEKGAAPGGLGAFANGYSANGKASTVLTRVLAAGGLSWSIQDGELVILGPQEVTPGQAVLLKPSSGLVGSPELQVPDSDSKKKKPATLRLTSLMQPAVRPGTQLKVESEGVNGFFRADSVEHRGDSLGSDEWFTVCEVLPL